MSLSEDLGFSPSVDSDRRVRIAVFGAFGALMQVLHIVQALRIATFAVRAIAGSAVSRPLLGATTGHLRRVIGAS